MEKVILVIMLLATVTSAEVSVQCSEQFIAQHGSSFPVSGSCEKYLVCSGGQLVEQACQNGLQFNVEFSRCVPDFEANCSSARRQIIDNGKCNNSNDVSFHPDPHHCARYVLCLGNTTIPRLCAVGLLFNAEKGQCDFPQNVFCDVTCPSGGNELVFIGDSSGRDCARYSICLNGVPRPAKCSSMLYFDLVTGSCMQPEDAACRIRDVVCTSSDELHADSESCVSYYQCEGGLPHYRECGEGQIFSGGRCVPGYCGDREDTTVYETSTISSTAVVTETSTSHATPEFTTDHSSTIVDLGTSTTTGTTTSDAALTDVTVAPTIMTSETTYNPSTTTELSTSTVPVTSTTTQSITPSTITTSTTTPATIPEVTGTTQTETLSTMTSDATTESNISTGSSLPESTSMTSVITPESTTPVQTDSPSTVTSTQGSSTIASSTISPESSTLTIPITTTYSSTSPQTGSPPITESTNSTPTEPPPSTDPAIVCHGTGIALFPHPYRCDQYFVCIFGSGSLATCDGGLLFDRKSMVCVPADRVTCALN